MQQSRIDSTSQLSYQRTGGHHLRNKSNDRLPMAGSSTAGGPIDIFIDVDSPTTKNNNAEVVLMKSPSQASTLLQRTASPTRSMNNLEARIKQR